MRLALSNLTKDKTEEFTIFKCQWLGTEMKAEVTDTQKLRTMDQKQDRLPQ